MRLTRPCGCHENRKICTAQSQSSPRTTAATSRTTSATTRTHSAATRIPTGTTRTTTGTRRTTTATGPLHELTSYIYLSLTRAYPLQFFILYRCLSFTVAYPLQLPIPCSSLTLTVYRLHCLILYCYLSLQLLILRVTYLLVPYPLQFPWRALFRNPEVRSETSLDNILNLLV